MKQRARFRKMACLTQGQLGRMVGKSAGTICQWERGEIELDPVVVAGIYRAIEIELRKQFEGIFDVMYKGGLDDVVLLMGQHTDLKTVRA